MPPERKLSDLVKRLPKPAPHVSDPSNKVSVDGTVVTYDEYIQRLMDVDACQCIENEIRCKKCAEEDEIEKIAESKNAPDNLHLPCNCVKAGEKCSSCQEFNDNFHELMGQVDDEQVLSGILNEQGDSDAKATIPSINEADTTNWGDDNIGVSKESDGEQVDVEVEVNDEQSEELLMLELLNEMFNEDFYGDRMRDSVRSNIDNEKVIRGRQWKSFFLQSNAPPAHYKKFLRQEAVKKAISWEGASKFSKSHDFSEHIEYLWNQEYIAAIEIVMRDAFKKDGFETIHKKEHSWGVIEEAVLEEIQVIHPGIKELSKAHKRTIKARMPLWVDKEWPHLVKRVQNITEELFFSTDPDESSFDDYEDYVRRSLGFEALTWCLHQIIFLHHRQLLHNEGYCLLLNYKEMNDRTEEKRKSSSSATDCGSAEEK